ncbi:intracellular proteinase inhibitor [Fictibacillus macauensis ZFHKF-1]|uniref:Intracellular proteinase inhibitor n=1 Tax=Fictibacillus macauensis ZFHKF-1 TaxID=1196324 RepID=I8UFT4_9BACL|nr:BsuPI-related putative proteinase inhibitor [Fictibacillus macauensis]EIT85755.1 intracellular proteinase inhibitor [Fictibacillus macauensis ZFHKF-1]
MKKWLVLVVAVVLVLGACSSKSEQKEEKGAPTMSDGQKDKQKHQDHRGNQGIVQGKMDPSLKVVEEKKGKAVLRYEIKNQMEKEKTFHFTSGKKFDYRIKNKEGKTVYEYSKNHMFTQALTKTTVKQGASFTQDIMVSGLPAGSYTLEVWLTAKDEHDDYRQTQNFEIK